MYASIANVVPGLDDENKVTGHILLHQIGYSNFVFITYISIMRLNSTSFLLIQMPQIFWTKTRVSLKSFSFI